MTPASGPTVSVSPPLPPPPGGGEGPTRVSVVVPAFNGAGEIERTLASVAAQRFPDLDVLVVDDGSRDETPATVERFFQEHALPGRLLRHESNWGLSRTLNHGLHETSGDAVLFVHQDIALDREDWVARAVSDLRTRPRVAVVTGYYGLPAVGEVDFAQRTFGVMRRQFHAAPAEGVESVTFSEFKCDLVDRLAVQSVEGFPERFRIAGEDLWVSCALRAQGWTILKDYSLRSVQRFTGKATSVAGNLRKEFTFGKAIAGTLLRFRTSLARGLQSTPYSRSRSWNRASQPFVVAALVLLLLVAALTGSLLLWVLFGALLLGRLLYYGLRLYPGLRRILARPGRALAESVLGAPLGIATDAMYTAGLGTGIVSWALGRKL